jgi:hypothetical protein
MAGREMAFEHLAAPATIEADPTSTVLKKMVAEIRGIARGTTGRIVMWC